MAAVVVAAAREAVMVARKATVVVPRWAVKEKEVKPARKVGNAVIMDAVLDLILEAEAKEALLNGRYAILGPSVMGQQGCRVRANLLQPKGFVNHMTVGERRQNMFQTTVFSKSLKTEVEDVTMEAISNKFKVLKVEYEKVLEIVIAWIENSRVLRSFFFVQMELFYFVDEVFDSEYIQVQHVFATRELNRLNGEKGMSNRGGIVSQYGRLTKFEFPKFYGEDVHGWLYRVNQKHGDNVSWTVYEQKVKNHFDFLFEDPMVELKILKHVTIVQLYQEQFEVLMNKVELSEAYAVSLFIGGLKDKIRKHVRMFKPKTVLDVYCLTKMQEATLQVLKTRQTPLLTTPRTPYATTSYANKTVSYPLKSATTTLALLAPNTISKPFYVQPRKQMTQNEIADKRTKNLCFYCDDKFVSGHKCSGQLFLLQICADKSASEEYKLEVLLDEPVVQNFRESITDTQVISLHAMTRGNTYKTMRMVLRGIQKAALQWMSGKRQSKEISNGQVLCVYPKTLLKMTQTTTSPLCSQITALLDSYQVVFVTLTSIPTKRKQDHIIPLVPNIPPINIRSYKHPPNQKDVVEAMEHLHHLQLVLQVIRQNSLYAKMNKCNFAAKQVEYLGHIISRVGVSIDLSKIIAMQKWPTPVTLKPLRGFHGLTALKVAMSQDPVLALPNFNKPFIVETDVSKMGIAYPVLLQPLPIPTKVWHDILMDFIEALPSSQGCMTRERPKERVKWVSLDVYWYNTNYHSSAHTTPFEIVYGQPPNLHLLYIGGTSSLEEEATLQVLKTRQTPLLTTLRTPYATTSCANKTVSYPPKSATTTLALTPPNTISKPVYVQPRKQMTQKEIADKRAKNLCFYCDKKFLPGHKCSGHLFLLQICVDKSDSEEYELEALLDEPVENGVMRPTEGCFSMMGGKRQSKEISNGQPTPVTLKQLRGFHRLRGYYRRFIKDYASINKPLTSLLKKNSFAWNSSVHASFEALKVAMSQDQVLALLDFNKAFIVETDALGMGIGVVLQQGGHPIAYLSLEKWRRYLLDRHFKIKTDHFSLKYLLDQRLTTPFQAKWLPKLLGYNYEISYKQGSENHVPDALSKISSGSELCSIILSIITSDLLKQIKHSWEIDVDLQLCMTGERPKEWVKWVFLDEYWYNTNYHNSAHTTPFEIVYEQPPNPHLPYIAGSSSLEEVDRTIRAREQAIAIQSTVRQGTHHKFVAKYYRLFVVIAKVGKVGVLPLCRPDGVLSVEPEAIIGKRLGKLNNKAILYVLVKWVNQTEEEATWELYTDLL
uniref:Putative mitochondrial protein n=1 Tax=Tanacetum cinerariifolium TaxID=118510 RepID=A0A6L2JS04_TANCI|nr:putative mitochondrial protein [Tanacetum cinerariifolium]